MTVLVDTSVWTLALRRRRKQLDASQRWIERELSDLIREGDVAVIGPVRQELLSGIADAGAFERLRGHLRHFEDEPLTIEDFEEAARCHNRCRSAGISGSAIDFLLCAAALRRGWEIFTTDSDFDRYAAELGLSLHEPRGMD
ncbi:MAG: PIN domain-containing protein [Planctomycetaceae bacterium]